MAETIERVYKITTDANDAVRELNKLNKQVGEVDNKLAKAGAAIKGAFAGAAVVGAITTVTNALADTVDMMDDVSKSAQKIGISTEGLTSLTHAASMSGVEFNALEASLIKLNKQIAATASGNGGKAAAAFERLGVSVTDAAGALKNSEQVFSELATAFSNMPDGAQKSALAMDIFGKSGAQLIPLLNEGAAGLANFAAEAERLGIVVDSASGKLAENFNDNLEKIGKTAKGVQVRFMEGLLPALSKVSDELAESAGASDLWTNVGEQIGRALEIGKNALDIFFNWLESKKTIPKAVYDSIGAIWSGGGARGQGQLKATLGELETIWSGALDEMNKNTRDTGAEIQDIFMLSTETAKEAADKTRKAIEDQAKKDPPKIEIVPVITVPQVDPAALAALDTQIKTIQDDVNALVNDDLLQASKEITENADLLQAAVNSTSDGVHNISAAAEQLKKTVKESKEETEGLQEVSYAIGQTLADGVGNFVDQLVEGEFTFKKFVSTMIIEIGKLIAKIQILNALKASSTFGSLFQSANGSAFDSTGLAHGVYTSPHFFPMAGTGKRYFANGGVGVLAEAGPEAIMPLRRGSDGRLGVEAKGGSGGNINIHNYSNSEVTARRVDDDIEIVINRVASDILRGGSKIAKAMEGTYSMSRVRGK